jgi:hypothetical protein
MSSRDASRSAWGSWPVGRGGAAGDEHEDARPDGCAGTRGRRGGRCRVAARAHRLDCSSGGPCRSRRRRAPASGIGCIARVGLGSPSLPSSACRFLDTRTSSGRYTRLRIARPRDVHRRLGIATPGPSLLGSLARYDSGGLKLNKAASRAVKPSGGGTRSSPDGRGLRSPSTEARVRGA